MADDNSVLQILAEKSHLLLAQVSRRKIFARSVRRYEARRRELNWRFLIECDTCYRQKACDNRWNEDNGGTMREKQFGDSFIMDSFPLKIHQTPWNANISCLYENRVCIEFLTHRFQVLEQHSRVRVFSRRSSTHYQCSFAYPLTVNPSQKLN